jgi:DNA-directed RNA polymerase specialized sigma24 family protein
VTDQRGPDDATISRVLAAARAAAAGDAAAEDAVVRAFAAAGPGPHDAGRLAAAAVRLALRTAPAAPFAAMAPPDAEAVAVVRLAGLGAADAGAVLGVATGEVGRRLTRGLMAVRAEAASARGRSACAGGEAARASTQPVCARAQMACA